MLTMCCARHTFSPISSGNNDEIVTQDGGGDPREGFFDHRSPGWFRRALTMMALVRGVMAASSASGLIVYPSCSCVRRRTGVASFSKASDPGRKP